VNLLLNIEGHVRNESYQHAPDKFDYWYGRIWNDYIERVSSSKLTSAYSFYNQAKSSSAAHPSYTNYTRDFKATLDYIFFSQDNIRVLSLLEVPDISKGDSVVTSLPNAEYPSDHLRIEAVLQFIEK
jgi:mRNA deadenylase 3'-5' endonuclease subunit Ccr4